NRIIAIETENGADIAASPPVELTYDLTPPLFLSTAPTSALVGRDVNYDAQTNEEASVSGLIYSLVGAPAGATINATTGVVTWTPTAAQIGSRSFFIAATDGAGNTSQQAIDLSVSLPEVKVTLTITKPDGDPLIALDV